MISQVIEMPKQQQRGTAEYVVGESAFNPVPSAEATVEQQVSEVVVQGEVQEQMVMIPTEQIVEKIVEIPEVSTVEKIVEVVQTQIVPKTVERTIEQVVTVPRYVDVPQIMERVIQQPVEQIM